MQKPKSTKLRFASVGIANTTIDFGLLFVLHLLGVSTVTASIISSTAAFIFSFVANRSYTFTATEGKLRQQIIRYFIVTLTSAWLLQSGMILLTEPLFKQLLDDSFAALAAKGSGIAVGLVWNYILYSKYVFADKSSKD